MGNEFSSSLSTHHSLLLFQFLTRGSYFFNGADHVERLLGDIVVLAVDDLSEAFDSVFELDVLAFAAREL